MKQRPPCRSLLREKSGWLHKSPLSEGPGLPCAGEPSDTQICRGTCPSPTCPPPSLASSASFALYVTGLEAYERGSIYNPTYLTRLATSR